MDDQTPFHIDPAVLTLLRCPRTGVPLMVSTRAGRTVLTTQNEAAVYEIRDGIPVLLPPLSDSPAVPERKDEPSWPKAST